MKNIGSIISAHNRNILNLIVQSYACNCRVKSSRLLNGECLTPKMIYRADVSNDKNSEKKLYFGLADTPLKKGTETIQGTLNMKSMRIAPNWLNTSGN